MYPGRQTGYFCLYTLRTVNKVVLSIVKDCRNLLQKKHEISLKYNYKIFTTAECNKETFEFYAFAIVHFLRKRV